MMLPMKRFALRALLCVSAALAQPIVGCAAPFESQPEAASVGLSAQGRPLLARTFGHGAHRIYVVAGIHGDEREGALGLDALRGMLAQRRWSSRATVRVLEDMNPDGSLRGTRASGAGVDLNRAWPATNARAGTAPQPEVTAALADMERFAPRTILVLHSAGAGPFVNYDGPASGLAGAFVRGANQELARAGRPARWHVRAEMGYATPGSMGSYWGKDRRIAILTIEFDRGMGAEDVVPALTGGFGAVLGER